MNPKEPEINEIREAIRHTFFEGRKIIFTRAYVLAACAVAREENTDYHFPAFFLVHQSLELLIKNVFNVVETGPNGHKLMHLFSLMPSAAKDFLNERDVELLLISDQMNAKYKMKYPDEPNTDPFDWAIYVEFLELCKKIFMSYPQFNAS